MDAAAVGFRFHPNEEELIDHFLVLKLTGHDDLVDDVIGEIDVFRREPSDLPDFARIRSNDQVWYFFCYLEKKYSNGKRVNRRTPQGVWKLTGNVREIEAKGTKELIGTQKKMVFHIKVKGSKDIKTNWVIHEYQHISTLDNPTALVLCKLKNKANAGLPLLDEAVADELQFQNAEDAVDLPLELPQDLPHVFSDDEDQGDLTRFVDSLLNEDDESDVYLCTSISELQPSKPSEGHTSTSQHRQMKAINGDDIFIMRAGSAHSSRVSHGEINSVEWLGEEFPTTSKLQHQPQSLNIIAKDVIPPKSRRELQIGGTVHRKEGREAAKHGATKYGNTSGIREVDEETPRIRKPQIVRQVFEEVKVSRIMKPEQHLKFTSKEAGQDAKHGVPVYPPRRGRLPLTSEPDPDLSSEASTSNDQKRTFVPPKPKAPPSSHNLTPPYVYLTNIVVGLIWGVIILWDMLH